MGRILIGLLIGLIVGGFGTFYFFMGVPRAQNLPGTPIQRPDPSGMEPRTAQVVLRQEMFNEILSTIFTQMNSPSFALSNSGVVQASADGCSGSITVVSEGSGVRTAVNFQNNRIEAPIAFTGGYLSPFGCLNFTGWANSVLELRFDQASQSVFGQINIETVNLDGVNPLVNAVVTPLVQSTLNTRVNPIRIIAGPQLAINAPIVSAKGNLAATVKDVRAEVKDNSLNLYVVYDLNGSLEQPAAVSLPN